MTTTAYERVVDALRANGNHVKETGDGKAVAQCPAHDDNSPSLSIKSIDGSVLLYCHAGCPADAVLGAVGLTVRDLYDNRNGAEYHYPDGRVVHRTATKRFYQKGNVKGRTLFNADKIGDAELVYVVEGEKDVLAVEAAGGVAVCSAMGAGKAHLADWSPLTGRDVVIVADKDEPGRKHAAQIAGLLDEPIARSVRIVEAKQGKDAADHIAAGWSLTEFIDVVSHPQNHTATPQHPWSGDGSVLLDDLRDTLNKYVVFPDDHAAVAVTLWIAATHALPAFECAPRLVITSPEKRCGKTRLLDIITGVSHKPLATSDATVAAIFRSLRGDHPPTLVIDEADAIFGSKKAAEQNEDLRKLLNAGHQRGRPAIRCVGPLQIPTEFPVFAMAAIAGIGDMPDTITDRAVNIKLRRRAHGEKVSQFRSRRDGPILDDLRGRLAAWAAAHAGELGAAQPRMPVEDRAADTWEPLVAVADAAGGHWPDMARAACKVLVAAADEADEEGSLSVKLLTDIRRVFTGSRASFLSSADLVADLRRIEDSPWGEFELTARKLAYRLKNFGVKPDRNPAGNVRGYRLADLSDAFGRYLAVHPSEPSEASETMSDQGQSSDTLEASDGSIRQTDLSVRRETAGQTLFSDDLTDTDGCPPEPCPPPLFDVPPTNGEVRKCRCGNKLDSLEAIRSSKCKPCRDKAMAGYDS
jgi:5S rRNA maturation endonuclease (ribonuclease M5)